MSENLSCSFCGACAKDVIKLIEGPEVYICNECIDTCHDIVHASPEAEQDTDKPFVIPSPHDIKTHLDEYVIGQDSAKLAVSVAVYNHYKRITSSDDDGVELEKSNILLIGPSAVGKAQPLSAKVLTSNDTWTTIGELAVGSLIRDSDGGIQEVIGVYPQGTKEVCKVEFLDGRTTECCIDHLWEVSMTEWSSPRVLTTREIMRLLANRKHKHLAVRLYKPCFDEGDAKQFPLHPHVVGALLGDGCLGREYLYGDAHSRRELLRGLMDTDGTADAFGRVTYSTTSIQLADDVCYLVRSLGGLCSITAHYVKDGVRHKGRRCYTCTIRIDDAEELFHMPRKKALAASRKRPVSSIKISSVTPIGEKETRCIRVSNPNHLYVTDDFILTHNTQIAKTIAKILDVPFAMADATTLTETGYVGDDVESIVSRLLTAADHDPIAAQHGIIFIDEVDKLRKKAGGVATKDIGGEGVQQALLKLLEGSEIMVPSGGRRGPAAEFVKIDTRNILFICGGAFVGIEEITNKTDLASIGFGSKIVDRSNLVYGEIEPEHLAKYGMIPEFIGRIPVIATLSELTEAQLVRVLTEPKNSIVRQFEKLFALDGVKLSFEPEALHEIARMARKHKTGARGLRGVMEKSLLTLQFDLPSLAADGVKEIQIGADVIAHKAQPKFTRRRKRKVAK